MDSRLRMAGKLKAVYIRTDEGVLIKVEPNARIPRTLEEFCDMMGEYQISMNHLIKCVQLFLTLGRDLLVQLSCYRN